MSEILSNINKLEEKRRQGTPKYNFNAHLELDKIEIFEKENALTLPQSYKQFMASFNGGMILEEPESYYTDMTEWEPDGMKWSSFYFYTLSELSEEYSDLKSDTEIFRDDFEGIFPIIPICNTPKQKTIVLVSQNGLSKESPVFISDDINDLSTYEQIYDDFDSFLGKIIEHDGFPNIKAKQGNKLLSNFISDNNLLKTESDSEIIERITSLIKLDPNNAWNYYERGNAYKYTGQRKLALADFNKAIEVNDKEALFYYCRGALLLSHGSKRRSLIDLDIAVKLDPGSKLFLTGRADAFQRLGKLDKALSDCNKVLNEDCEYALALYVRERVYKAMGEDELAQADSDLIDELK